MAWLYLFLAGLFEIGWAIVLKYTEGFSRLFPSLLTVTAWPSVSRCSASR
jgi:quaternary ammonium compound-resistance protein SugE